MMITNTRFGVNSNKKNPLQLQYPSLFGGDKNQKTINQDTLIDAIKIFAEKKQNLQHLHYSSSNNQLSFIVYNPTIKISETFTYHISSSLKIETLDIVNDIITFRLTQHEFHKQQQIPFQRIKFGTHIPLHERNNHFNRVEDIIDYLVRVNMFHLLCIDYIDDETYFVLRSKKNKITVISATCSHNHYVLHEQIIIPKVNIQLQLNKQMIDIKSIMSNQYKKERSFEIQLHQLDKQNQYLVDIVKHDCNSTIKYYSKVVTIKKTVLEYLVYTRFELDKALTIISDSTSTPLLCKHDISINKLIQSIHSMYHYTFLCRDSLYEDSETYYIYFIKKNTFWCCLKKYMTKISHKYLILVLKKNCDHYTLDSQYIL